MQYIPPITRNLLIINVVCYLLQIVFRSQGIDLADLLGLHFFMADSFGIYQLVTYLFLHGGFLHLSFNMFSLWMFGGVIERTLGTRRFLWFFFICGIGAGICQELWQAAQYFNERLYEYSMVDMDDTILPMGSYLNFWTTIGASGACYGILLAYGVLYPNNRIMLLFPPIPMKAKYFVAGYAAIEVMSACIWEDNIAHFAHLGGMLFGWLLLRYWRKKACSATNWGSWQYGYRTRKNKSWVQQLKDRLRGIKGGKDSEVGNARHTATRDNDYEYNMRQKADEARMDEILDKIRQSGYDSLTTEEKQELFRISRR